MCDVVRSGDGQGEGALSAAGHSDECDALWSAVLSGAKRLRVREDPHGLEVQIVDASDVDRGARLSPDDAALVRLIASGCSGKTAAFTLGWTESTVSRRFAMAARSLGVESSVKLLRVAALLRAPRGRAAGAHGGALTKAEQEVLSLVRGGLANHQIATRRRTSVRTIANQVSSLLRKTGASSRRALIASLD